MNKIKLITFFNKLLPKYKKKVVFYGRSRYDSNNHALIQYMIENGYNDKYKIYLVVSNEDDLVFYQNIKNVYPVKGAIAGAYHTLSSKYVFHCYGMGKMSSRIPKNQIVFDLWHGIGLKALSDVSSSDYNKRSKYILATCDYGKNYFMKCFGYKSEQFYIGGYPRCEQLFSGKDVLKEFGIDKSQYAKIILYMPTFRKAKQFGYDESVLEFPLFDEQKLSKFNDYLAEKNILFIIKPHPAQDNLNILNFQSSNVKVIKNRDLLSKKMMLYSLVGQSDVLITDYSSIYFDYLLTQRPICFVIDDIDSYSDKRGFVVENPEDYMAGEKIKDVEQLQQFLDGILDGKDMWKEKRAEINDMMNPDKSLDYSKNILDFVGITKEK